MTSTRDDWELLLSKQRLLPKAKPAIKKKKEAKK